MRSVIGGDMNREIIVQVDAIALQGVSGFDADGFTASLTHRLLELTSENSTDPRSVEVPAVSIQTEQGVDSATLGHHVALAIYAQLERGTE